MIYVVMRKTTCTDRYIYEAGSQYRVPVKKAFRWIDRGIAQFVGIDEFVAVEDSLNFIRDFFDEYSSG